MFCVGLYFEMCKCHKYQLKCSVWAEHFAFWMFKPAQSLQPTCMSKQNRETGSIQCERWINVHKKNKLLLSLFLFWSFPLCIFCRLNNSKPERVVHVKRLPWDCEDKVFSSVCASGVPSPRLVDVRALTGGAGRRRLRERPRVQDSLRSGVHRRLGRKWRFHH